MMMTLAKCLTLLATLPAAIASDAALPPSPAGDVGQWIVIDDYPSEAIVKHQEGTVGFRLDVNAEGAVVGCTVTKGSGASALDAKTCGLLFLRARFEPGRDDQGNAIAGVFASKIQWVFPDKIEPEPDPKPVEIGDSMRDFAGESILLVDTEGIVTRCSWGPKPYSNVLALPSICHLFPVGSRFGPPGLSHGKPVKRKINLKLEAFEVTIR